MPSFLKFILNKIQVIHLMNEIVEKYLLAGVKFIREMQLR